MKRASPSDLFIAATVVSPASRDQSTIAIRAPSSAKSLAVALPIPVPPPVITALVIAKETRLGLR